MTLCQSLDSSRIMDYNKYKPFFWQIPAENRLFCDRIRGVVFAMQADFAILRDRIPHLHMEHYPKLGGSGFTFHSHIELLWIRKGSAKVWIGEGHETVREGEFAVVLSYEAHFFRSDTDGAYTCLYIPVMLCPEFADAVRNRRLAHPVIRAGADADLLAQACDRLGGPINAIEQAGWIRVILGILLAQSDWASRPSPREDDLPARIFSYISEHYAEELTLESVAQALGYSADYLSESFRSSFHMPLGRCVNTLRLRHAVEKLREKKHSITECALESGFGSMRTFYRAFREEFGCSPREYLRGEG